MKLLLLILKNIRRNLLRSTLTSLGVLVLVFVVTLIWSVLWFLDLVTAERSRNFKGIVSERWRMPSQMPFSYATTLEEGAAREPGDVRPEDSMTWQFFGGSFEPDPRKRTRDNTIFGIALEPAKLGTMMDELDQLPADKAAPLLEAIAGLEGRPNGIIMGRTQLQRTGKQIGDRFTLYGLNYRDINLEFEVVGTFPEGRYDNTVAFHRHYLLAALDAYQQARKRPHPLADKTLNLVWLKVPDRAAFDRLGAQITSSPLYASPAVKFETASSGIATFLEAYRDLLWGMRWLLAPAILATLALVISNAISISVRERRTEMAVLKVLGFRPAQILLLVLGEAVLLGGLSGLVSSSATYILINHAFGGLKFPIAFFPAFFIPEAAIWWGLAVGAGTALSGSLVPAWNTRSVRVADVFAKVA